jgi:hypothetical protein
MTASWWAWWFGGAFGHRAFLDFLPVFVWPIAALLEYLRGYRVYVYGFCLFFLLMSCLYTTGLAHLYESPWDGPEWGWDKLWSQIRRLGG